jgi:hypothetical protein
MAQSPKHKKLAENEVIFRNANERVASDLLEIEHKAKEEGDFDLMYDKEVILQFYCECSDELCKQRIKLSPHEYAKVHKNSSQFIMLPGHSTPEIERVVMKRKKYIVAEKFMTPPSEVSRLKNTRD